MGAIFRGAQLNNQFRVKDIRSKDYSTYPILIETSASLETGKGIPTLKYVLTYIVGSKTLFPVWTKLGNSKSLSFKTSEDFTLLLSYPSSVQFPADITRTLLSANVVGVAEKIEKLKGTNECDDQIVKVNFKLSDAGIVEIVSGEVQCELREKKNLADKLMGIFGGGKDKGKEEEQVVFKADELSTSSTASSTASSTSSAAPGATGTADKVRYEKSAVRISTVDLSKTAMTEEEKVASRKRYCPDDVRLMVD